MISSTTYTRNNQADHQGGLRPVIHLSVPRNDAEPLAIELSAGETLFVLGTNGAGKSSLMFHFNSQSRSHSRWLSAHRQTLLDSGTVNLAPRRVDEIEQNFRTSDRSAESRWKDNKGNQLIQLALRNLIQRINLQGRQAVLSLRNLDFESASKIADPTNDSYGIIDGDGREADQIERLRGEHIYSLDAYLVESIYYDGKVREATARRQAKVTGADANVRLQDAKIAALSLDDNSRENLCKRMAEYVVHRQIHQETLNRNDGMFDGPVNIQVDTQTILQQERGRLSDLIVDQNLDAIIRRYPIKQSAIPDIIF